MRLPQRIRDCIECVGQRRRMDHNPSGFDVRTQQSVAMPRATFDRYFANRGILIAPSRCVGNEPDK